MDKTQLANPEDTLKNGVYAYTSRSILNAASLMKQEIFAIKVGCSHGGLSTMERRVNDQERAARTSINPSEELVFLRAYPVTDSLKYERTIHNILKAGGFHIQAVNSGIEWFETSLDFLDAIAEGIGLSQPVIPKTQTLSLAPLESKELLAEKAALRINNSVPISDVDDAVLEEAIQKVIEGNPLSRTAKKYGIARATLGRRVEKYLAKNKNDANSDGLFSESSSYTLI